MESTDKELRFLYKMALRSLRDTQKRFARKLKELGTEYTKHPSWIGIDGSKGVFQALKSFADSQDIDLAHYKKIRRQMINRGLTHPGDRAGGDITQSDIDRRR